MSATQQSLIDGNAQSVVFDVTNFKSVSLQFSGTFVGTCVVEVANDPAGPWIQKTIGLTSPDGLPLNGTFSSPTIATGDIGEGYIQIRSTAWTSGTVVIKAILDEESVSVIVSSQPVSNTLFGTGASAGWKVEDTAGMNSDVGILTFGQRGPTIPVARTSAQADYGTFLIDPEGKQIISGSGSQDQYWEASADFTLATDVVLIATAGATLRRYLNTLILENTGAAAARVILKDGTTRRATFTIPPTSTLVVSLGQPLRTTVNAAWQVALGAAGTVSITAAGFNGI